MSAWGSAGSSLEVTGSPDRRLVRSPPFLQVSCCSILAGPSGPQFTPGRGKGPPRHKDEFAESWVHPTQVIAGTE